MIDDARTGIRDALVGTPVDRAILLWADWTKGGGKWPGASSPAALLMLAKKLGVCPRGTAVLPDMPPEAAKVDALVARLERELKRPFKVYYLQYKPSIDKARICGFGDDTTKFYRHVKRARLWIADGWQQGRFDFVPRFSIKSAQHAATAPRSNPT